jgi:hypothetical protein
MASLTLLARWPDNQTLPEKEGNRFGSLEYIKAHGPRNAAFFRAYAVARLQWAAVVGRRKPAGFPLVYRSSNPAICRPPRLEAGSGVTNTQGVAP